MLKSFIGLLMPILISLSIVSCGSVNQADKMNKIINVSTSEDCSNSDGYWYKEKCWLHFKEYDGGISKEDIDQEVDRMMKEAEKYYLKIDGKTHPIKLFFPEEEGNTLILITVYADAEGDKTLLCVIENMKEDEQTVMSNAMLIKGNLAETEEDVDIELLTIAAGELKGKLVGKADKLEFKFNGEILQNNKELEIQLFVGESLVGLGSTSIEIREQKAYINGILGTKTYTQMKDLIVNHPEIKTLILENVPGSMNDDVNMHTGRLVKENGINTVVKSNSIIASGGVDLFCAGNERIIHRGAKLGIHSWGGEGISAHELALDHPAHQYQIAYFTMCLGKKMGPDFYFHTLTAAEASDIHWMSDSEISTWKLATSFISK